MLAILIEGIGKCLQGMRIVRITVEPLPAKSDYPFQIPLLGQLCVGFTPPVELFLVRPILVRPLFISPRWLAQHLMHAGDTGG